METATIRDVIYGRKFGMGLCMDIVKPARPSGIGVVALSSGGWKSFPEMGKPETAEFAKRGQTVFIACHGSRPRFSIAEIVQDIRRAIRFARACAPEHGVDPNRLAIFGISSGGNLSLMSAAQGGDGDQEAVDPIDRQPDRVGAVGCFYPPTDLANFGQPGKIWLPYRTPEEIGTDAELARAHSPINYFTPAMPPTLIIHGDRDELVPIQQGEVAIARLAQLGVKHHFEPRPGKPHGWPNMAAEYALCAEWFDRHLAK